MQVAEEGGVGAEHRDDTPPRFPPRAHTSRPSGSVQTDRLMAAVWADNLEADVVSPSCTQDPVAAPIPSRRRASPRSFSDAAGFAASERGSFTRSHLADILEADANDDGDFTGVITGRKLMSTDGFSDVSIPTASEKDLNSGSSEVLSPKVKLMCSFEGQILPRPIDGKLRYVGGETRVISVRRSIRIGELLRRLMELYDRAVVLKYQLPEEDLDALVSVSTDEDLENMMEESDKLLSSSVEGGSSLPSKIRVFLFPASGGSDASSMVGIEDRRDSEQRYIDAINEAVDTTSARKQFDASSRGSSQNLAGFEIAEASHSPSSFGFVQASVASWVPIDPVLPPSFNNNNNNNNNSNNNNKRDPGIGKHFGSNMSSSSSSHQFDKRLDTCFPQPSVPPPDSLGVDMPEKQPDSCRKTDFKGHYGNSQTSNLAYPAASETIPLPPYQKADVHDLESGFGRGLLSNYNETPQPSKAPILNLPRLLSNYNETPQPSNESFPGSTRGSFQPISSSSEEPLSNVLPFIDSKDPTFLRSEHNADELEFLSGIWMTTPGPKENQEFTDPQWKTQIETHDKSQSNIFLTPLCDSPMGMTASFSPSQGDIETRNGNSLQQSKEPHPEENLSILSWSIDSGVPSFRCSEHDDVDEAGFLTGAWMAPPLSQKIEWKESEGRSTDSNEHSSYDFFGVPPSSSAKKQEQTHKSHSEIEAATIFSSFEDSQEITRGNSMGQTDERRSEEHSSSLTPLLDGVDPADPSFRRSEHVDVDEVGFLTGGWMMSSLNQKTVSASASSSSSSLEESEGSVDCNEQLYSFLFKDSQLRTQVESINISSSPPAVCETHNSQSESILSHFPLGPISSSSSSSFTSSVVQEDHETRNGNPLQQTQESLSTPLPLSSHNELDVAGESGFSTGTWMTLLSQMVSKQSQVSNDSYEQSYAVLSADYQRRAQLDLKHPLSSSPKNRADNVELIPSSSPTYIKNSSVLNETSKSPPNRGLQDSLSMQKDTREETTPATSLKPSDSVPSSSEGGKSDNMLSVDDLLGLNAKKELNRIDSGTSKSEGDIHPSFKQENSSLVGYSSVDFIFLHHKQTKETPLPITQSDKDSLLPSIIHPLLANTESGATAMPGVEGIEEVIVLESSDSAKPVFSVFESQQEEQKERDRMFDQNWEKVLQQAEAEEQLLIANANEEISKADLELEKEGGNYEESKTEDTNMPRNVAAEAEAEAISRGLQTIRNADLEERRELGSGTFGTVYHGKWRGTDVAIKRIKSSCFMGRPAERESLMADFWREAIILGQLHHPNVVAFYGVVPDGPGGTLATVTEFMVNGSLKHVLQMKDRSIDHRKRLLIAMDAAFGMEYLHGKRIVHFDLKCENLLVNMRDPHRPICKVGDLGLSKVKQQTMVSGGVRGTLPWMAPELLNGSSNLVSERVDVFSFGIAMWEILTGMEPYQDMHYGAIIGGIASNTLRPSIPRSCNPAWRSLMVRCWSADPMERPPFSEIARELRSMAALVQPKAQQARP